MATGLISVEYVGASMEAERIELPGEWTAPPAFEASGVRWHRYRYHPTETVAIEVRLGEALVADEPDRFRLQLSMRLADRGPVTHDFRVGTYEELADARRVTESLLRGLADELFDSDPVARVQAVVGELRDPPSASGGVLSRLYRRLVGG